MKDKDTDMVICPCSCERAEREDGGSGGGRAYLPPHLVRLMHWVLAGSLGWLLLTGVGLHAMARPGEGLFDGYPSWLPWWRMALWHRVGAVLFASALVPMAVSYARRWNHWPRWHHRQWLHLMLLVGGLVMVASGLVLLRTWGDWDGLYAVRWVHRWTGLVVMSAGLVFHAVLGLTVFVSMLVGSFAPWRRPQWGRVGWFALSLAVMSLLLTNLGWGVMGGRRLVARRVARSETDRPLDRLPWSSARPVEVRLYNGVGFDRGMTRMRLQALHDGQNLYLRVIWSDGVEDRRYMPWRRTADGWQRLVCDERDETVYYEDKMALMFPIDASPGFAVFGCATSCHGGGGRPYGYKSSPALTDVWHWKSSRTDPVGQADDKYWNDDGPQPTDGGRHGDPAVAGTGYLKNVSADKSRPAWLPEGPGAVRGGAILAERARPWSAQAEQAIAAGTIVPGLVVSAFQGDRGQVACQSRYRDGRWEVYLRRALQTGSGYDVQFEPGRTYPFGCAAFDHAAKRHAYNYRDYVLYLEP